MQQGARLEGRVVLVTGGGTGIGRATCLSAAREGARVIVNYSRSRDDAEQTVRDIRATGAEGVALQADVSRDEEVRAMLARVQASHGKLDVLVNNAGTTTFVPFADLEALTEEMWDRVWAVNVKGTFFVTRQAAPLLRKAEGSQVINIASVAGMTGFGSSMAYCASKAAVISLTKSLARALAPSIRVNAVAPGFVDSRWTAGQDVYRQRHLELTPLGKVCTPDDVAEVALALATSAGMVTGQVIVVDGGRTL
jgi:3-oxoacyl-[acyl-carrier protein] reductase